MVKTSTNCKHLKEKAICLKMLFLQKDLCAKNIRNSLEVLEHCYLIFKIFFWNVVSRELHYSKDFNIKNVNDVKNWKQIYSTGNQTKDYINIMKSFNLDYSNEEIDIKQDFLENIKNLQSILK